MADEVKDETESFEVTSSDAPDVQSEPEQNDTTEEPASSEDVEAEDDKSDSSEEKTGDESAESVEQDSDINSSDNTTADSESGKKDKGYQKRINKVVRQREDAKRENERLKREIEELKASEKSSDKTETHDLVEPKEEDFKTYGEYLDALDEYDAKVESSQSEVVEKKEATKEQTSSPDKTGDANVLTDSQKSAMAVIKEAVDSAEKPDDFNEVALDESVPVDGDMLELIAECDDPAKVLYYLGSNKDKAAEIAESSLVKKAIAISKIDNDSKVPPKPVKTTKVNDPIETVNGSTTHDKAPKDMSYSEYEAYRNKQERAKSSTW